MWIANAARCREIDRRSIEEFGVPATVLMERAGAAVFDVLHIVVPEGSRVTVYCGKGNNGGDGLVVARHAHAHGYLVDCLVAALEHELSRDATTQLAILRSQGVQPIFYDDELWARKAGCIGCRNVIVDALLGTGAKGDVVGPIREAIRIINDSGVPVISVDVPSGIDTDTGEDLGESVWATRTVTFGLPKPYLFQGLGLEHSGYWTVADIGFPLDLVETPTDARLLEPSAVCDLMPIRMRSSHKGDNGHVLIVAGSGAMPGAAVLAAKAALRSGAGLVTVASTESVCRNVAAHLPEVLLLPLPECDGAISPEAAQAVVDRQGRVDSAVFGPGMTHEEPVREFLTRVWEQWNKPAVIDADALNVVSLGVRLPNAECVLTPHPGEMGRLLQRSTAEVQARRFVSVRNAVDLLGKTVLLKGPFSVVASPEVPFAVNSTGNPGMATGGMGDVLSGVIATLLAQEMPPNCAATCGMYWHGLAADLCAAAIGPVGYRASEVAELLPQARAKLTVCDAGSASS